MTDSDDQAYAGTAEGQGPVRIDEELVANLELLEQFLALVGEVPGEFLVDADGPLAHRGAGVHLVVAVGHAPGFG